MFLLSLLSWMTPKRRPQLKTCLNCDSLEGRQLLTVMVEPRRKPFTAQIARPKTTKPQRLGTPTPVSSSQYANLAATSGSPKVFHDAATARSTQGLDGSGLTVAVIDTGVNYSLDALGKGFGSNNKVVAGYDFGMNDSDPMPTWSHGTAVSSVIGSTDPSNPGIAPGANIVALRVFDDSGNSTFGRIADALDWVVKNHAAHNISVVNISLSDSMNYTLNWFEKDSGFGQRITEAVAKLKELNIVVVSATGNSFKGKEGVGFTAIVKDTISVTGVDPQTNHLANNAQRLGSALAGELATDIAAPSSGFNVITSNGEYQSVDGTSFAAPVVSGSVLLLQQKYKEEFGILPTVDLVESWLENGGKSTIDSLTNLKIPQIDLAGSLALVPTNNNLSVNKAPISSTSPDNPNKSVMTSPTNIESQFNPALTASTGTTDTGQNTISTVRINGIKIELGTIGTPGELSLATIQANRKWQNLQVWTGEAIIRRSASAMSNPVPTGMTKTNQKNKVAELKASMKRPVRRPLAGPGRNRQV